MQMAKKKWQKDGTSLCTKPVVVGYDFDAHAVDPVVDLDHVAGEIITLRVLPMCCRVVVARQYTQRICVAADMFSLSLYVAYTRMGEHQHRSRISEC